MTLSTRRFISVILFAFLSGCLLAQQSKDLEGSAKPPRVINIRFSLSSGMCYGYCFIELEVERGVATLLDKSWSEDERKCPDIKVRADFSDKHWKEMTDLVDRKALLTLPERIGCPGCTDSIVESVEVQFSDQTKKKTTYDWGHPPTEIKALSKSLHDEEEKLSKELPPSTVTRCGN